ncbi:glutaredoxin family protein [Thermobifida halotolerans]|uniref:Glutaredoxin family protein n=2 Tax=Thermobifida halotolerans TaxID=483545 RepID=A0A399G3A4_9ACTN|nr:glutaredoxin family protein [Thermobifida halotolerans]UOE18460.1 glutaredoxin family protein [Thermobifida halotolerans]
MALWPSRPEDSENPHVVTMLGKPGCHLCDDALAVIARVCADLGARYEVRDITVADDEEKEEYWDKIPVVFVDGEQHDFWRVDERRLRDALR